MEEYKNYMNNKGNNKFKNRFPQNNQINHGQESNFSFYIRQQP